MKLCPKAKQARMLVRKEIKKAMEDISSSDDDDLLENETMLKVKLINEVAKTLIQKTREVYSEGLQLDEFASLEWEDFDNSNENPEIQDGCMSILDRDHLLSFVNDFNSADEVSILSGGLDFSEEELRERRNSADSWSVDTPRKCARLAAARRRSVSVSENFLEVPDILDVLPDVEEELPYHAPDGLGVPLRRRNAIRRKGRVQ